jgi:hypothetical protein
MHGGAHGSGAPRGNRNALKHGLYTKQALAERRAVNNILRAGGGLLDRIEKSLREAPPRRRANGARPARPRRRPRHKPATGPPGV